MALFGLVSFVAALVLIGIGVAVGLVACLLGALLVGLGVVSSSIFLGVRSGRPTVGVRAFLLQCGILAGIPAGAVGAGLVSLSAGSGGGWPVVLYGGVGGAVAGILAALLLELGSRRLRAWALARSGDRGRRPGDEGWALGEVPDLRS